MRFVENDLDPAIVTRVTNERTFWRDAMSTGRAVAENPSAPSIHSKQWDAYIRASLGFRNHWYPALGRGGRR
jgi:hypothetical protein